MRIIQHQLQKDLKMPAQCTAKKPLLTESMKKKLLNFCRKYKDWTSKQWQKVIFNDESTFRLAKGSSKTIRRPSDASRYDPQYMVKTVKHSNSVLVWGCLLW